MRLGLRGTPSAAWPLPSPARLERRRDRASVRSDRRNSEAGPQFSCQGCETVLYLFSPAFLKEAAELSGSLETVPTTVHRSRSVDARGAARAEGRAATATLFEPRRVGRRDCGAEGKRRQTGAARKWRRNGLKRLNPRPEMVWPGNLGPPRSGMRPRGRRIVRLQLASLRELQFLAPNALKSLGRLQLLRMRLSASAPGGRGCRSRVGRASRDLREWASLGGPGDPPRRRRWPGRR